MSNWKPRPEWIGHQVNFYTGKKGLIVIDEKTSEEDLQLIAELYPHAVEKIKKKKNEISDRRRNTEDSSEGELK